jgi:hypothetical protein
MGLSELILIMAMETATWSIDSDGIPQICMKVPTENEETFKGCTSVPEEILYKWLEDTMVKV